MPGGAKAKTRTIRSESPPPIDNLRITVNKGGIDTEVGAIHQGWVEPRDYIAFSWPPGEEGLQEGWLAGINLLIEDLRWLLRRPYHMFWSQVVHDLSLAACLDGTLQALPRPHELHLLPPAPPLRQAVQTVANLALRVTLRMATYKESKEHHMSPALFASLVYDNYLWDMPRLLDLCAVYAAGNTQLLQRQVANLFTQQPAYTQDLQMAALSMPELLGRLEERVCGTQQLGSGQLSWSQLWDVLLYLVDLASALDAFVMVYPDGSRYFVEAKLPVRLAAFYDTVIPRLWRRLESLSSSSEAEFPSADVVRRHLQLARHSLLCVFRRLVDYCCLRPLREAERPGQARESLESHGDQYMELMTECLGEQHFLADYNLQYPLSGDAETVRAGCPELDPARLEYVLDAVLGVEAARSESPPPLENDQSPPEPVTAAPPGQEAATPTGVELESMVSHVRDLLPDLSNSFVTACLQHYGFSTELVINAVLEDSLPPQLAALDRTAEAAPPEPPPPDVPRPVLSQMLASRRNVFDGDEYDVISRDDADVTAYHRGKRMTKGRLARELADKSELRASGVRERYQLFGSLTTDGSVYDAAAGGDQYEDEYDDTYDDGTTGQGEPEEEEDEEQRGVRLSAPLQSSRWRRPDPVEEPTGAGPPRNQFVQNPEEVRARQEARRQQQQQQRGGRRGRGGRQGPPPDKDVVGGPRGQGQSKQVVQNRRRKAEHKSTQARRGADRKARGGMF